MMPKLDPNKTHCNCECQFLDPFYDNVLQGYSAKCKITSRVLMWNDYWIATECGLMIMLENEEEI